MAYLFLLLLLPLRGGLQNGSSRALDSIDDSVVIRAPRQWSVESALILSCTPRLPQPSFDATFGLGRFSLSWRFGVVFWRAYWLVVVLL